ncbi:MAG TPA: hypothetical protein DCY20_06740, partial [Firmicutes bacterium]|nr:hypothetical protein [Bacillota bacterium]
LFCYEHDLKDKVMDVFDDYFNKQGEDADARIKNMLEGLKKLEENQSFDLKGVMKAVRQKDYPSLFLIIEMLDEHRGAQQLVEFLYLLDPAQFLVHFIAWWLTQPQEHDRTTLMPEKRHVLHQLKRCKIEASDIDTLKEESFLEEKLTLYLRQFITLETFCLFLELKSYLIPKEEIVKQLLICLAKQPTHASYSIRYALLKYLCDWCPTPKLFLTTARCCYRIKKYEDAAFYFKQCQCLSRQREDIQIEMYISTFLNGINDFKVLDEKHSPKMMRQVVLLLMSDRQFVKRRTEIYLYYLKNHCQLELLLWWYHLYRRLHQYDEALNVIDHLSQCDLTIYRDVLNHFKTKLEQRYQLNTQPLIEEVNQRLNLVENQVNPVKPSMLQPFKPDDIKLLKELMYKHDVIRQLPYHEIPFLELEWDVEYGKQKTGVLAWFKGVIEKFSLKSLFNKS